jgi:Secretion system C-terminal sorting domain
LPASLRGLSMDESISCIPNAVAGLTIRNGSSQIITPPICAPLPIELLNFKAQNTEGGHLLTWQTASEEKAAHFEVELSYDGQLFEKIGIVKTLGNNSSYSFLNTKLSKRVTTAYYRLNMKNLDGTSRLSNTLSLSNNKAGIIKIYPNPVLDKLYIDNAEGKTVVISNVIGQVVLRQTINNTSILSLESLTQGFYSVSVLDTEGVVFKGKIFKQ